MLYGCETHTDDTSRPLRRFIFAVCKAFLASDGGRRYHAHVELFEKAGIIPADHLLFQRQLRWLAHVTRMSDKLTTGCPGGCSMVSLQWVNVQLAVHGSASSTVSKRTCISVTSNQMISRLWQVIGMCGGLCVRRWSQQPQERLDHCLRSVTC